MQRNVGGDRIGSGNKMSVDMKTYNRSTHNLNRRWRSTMSAGTIVPFIKELVLPGDTIDIDLAAEVMTHPTIGPLFGEYKIELHIFEAPIRLYQALLHNNAINIGMKMNTVKLPVLQLKAEKTGGDENVDIDNYQINPSCILSYLGIRGAGYNPADSTGDITRTFNAVPWLAYWDTVKNYYANKQEEIGYVIHTERTEAVETVDEIRIKPNIGSEVVVPPSTGTPINRLVTNFSDSIEIDFTGTEPPLNDIVLNTSMGQILVGSISAGKTVAGTTITVDIAEGVAAFRVYSWQYTGAGTTIINEISLLEFPLENIDKMRNALLNNAASTTAKEIKALNVGAPYNTLLDYMTDEDLTAYPSTQEGLAIKTYDSDKLNNWMSTEWIEGENGIAAISAVDTSSGSFTIDAIVIARKVYNMLNRIALSGGTYKDYIDTVWTDTGNWICSTPIYHGGLIKNIVFQEVINNSGTETQPLGTLAGRGIMGREHKGGSVTVKVNEPGYIIGLVSITPIIDYSQGNDWDTHLKSMDELHPPEMDAIGFQDLITEEAAWWDTEWDTTTGEWIQKSAGKQPAWINYMTSLPKTYGNFAIQSNEMFMTLNRRYEKDANGIKDLTTYIDPSKYNFIFAETALDSQNFWVQIGIRMEARRLMSAKVMPNL